ncbi:hypothetical protein D3C72_1343140 [compost metagenome]
MMLVAGLGAETGFVLQAGIAQHGLDLRLVDDLLEFLGAQQRHRGHRHQTRLDRRQPRGRHHRVVRPAQQQAVAGDQAHVFGQHARDAVGKRSQFAIGHRGLLVAVAPAQRHAVGKAAIGHGVHEFHGAVEALGVGHVGAIKQEFRPLFARG